MIYIKSFLFLILVDNFVDEMLKCVVYVVDVERDALDGSEELCGVDGLGQLDEKGDDLNELHVHERVLVQIEDAESDAEQERILVAQEHVPHATHHIERQRLAEQREHPLDQVEVGLDALALEVRIQPGQIVLEEHLMHAEVFVHLGVVHAKARVQIGHVEHVGQAHERLARLHVEQQNGRQTRHALHVANLRLVARIGAQHAVQRFVVGSVLSIAFKAF